MKSIIKTIIIYSILFCSYLPSFALDVEVTNACGGGNSGSISVLLDNAPNGPFTYLWSNGESNTSSIENLWPGTYDVTIHDANDCVVTEVMTVEGGAAINANVTNVFCNSANEAIINIEHETIGTLQYSLNNGDFMELTTSYIIVNGDVNANSPYTITFLNEDDCEETVSGVLSCTLCTSITEPIETDFSQQEITCIQHQSSGEYSMNLRITNFPLYDEHNYTSVRLENQTHSGSQFAFTIDNFANWENQLLFAVHFLDETDIIMLIIENADGCAWSYQISCDEIVNPEYPVGSSNPPETASFPPENNITNITACANLETCFEYYAKHNDEQSFVQVSPLLDDNIEFVSQDIYTIGDITTGQICFVADDTDIGTRNIKLFALASNPTDGLTIYYQDYTIETRCCLSGYNESVTPALVGCNGNTLETGSYTIIPQTSGDCTPQADQLLINGNQQNTITNLDAGTHTFDINFEGTIITETVTIPSETTSFDVSYTTENTEGYFTYDAGVGSINLTVSNGFGPFYYDWEDCVAFEGIVVEDSEPELNFCDGLEQYERQNLLAGTYTVTITDEYTGCSVVESITINKTTVIPHQVFTNIFLEGTFNNSNMMTNYLRKNNLLPTQQPYRKAPWNYGGSESVADTSDIPPTAVDWILVEARHEADTTRTVARSAGFLLEDGNIVGTNGETLRLINLLENEKYYVIVRHRNHLAISSRNSITLPNTAETKYDFTTSITQAKGNEQMRLLPSGKFAMCAGDFNGDGMINSTDYQGYLDEASSINGYLQSDFNLDKHTSTTDFNLMLNNSGAMGVDWIRYE